MTYICKTALLENFGMLQAGFSRAQLEAAYGGKYLTWPGHIAHCFNRVRQSLMCHADSAVEGHIDGNERLITHDGVLHICNDFNALKNWAEEPERRLPENLKPVN